MLHISVKFTWTSADPLNSHTFSGGRWHLRRSDELFGKHMKFDGRWIRELRILAGAAIICIAKFSSRWKTAVPMKRFCRTSRNWRCISNQYSCCCMSPMDGSDIILISSNSLDKMKDDRVYLEKFAATRNLCFKNIQWWTWKIRQWLPWNGERWRLGNNDFWNQIVTHWSISKGVQMVSQSTVWFVRCRCWWFGFYFTSCKTLRTYNGIWVKYLFWVV